MTTYRHPDAAVTGHLAARYIELQVLKKQLDVEITAIENGLRVAGLFRVGRPKVPPTHTLTQCREAHARWQRGERDNQWVIDGERQYQRERKAAKRAEKKAAA